MKKMAHLMLLGSAFLWGINFISMKYLTDVFPTFSLIFIRFLIASVLLWTILLYQRRSTDGFAPLDPKDYKQIIITSIIGYVLYFLFQLFALKFLSANMTALLCALIPIISIPAESFYYKKSVHPIIYILSAISLYGVYLVLNMSLTEAISSQALWGILLMLSCILCWVLFTLITRTLQTKYDSLSMLTYQSTVATIIFGITASGDMNSAIQVMRQSDNALIIIGNLLFLGIGSSAFAYLFYIEGMKRIGIQLSSLYMNIIPIITALASYFVFKELMTSRQLIGMIIVIVSIILINKIDLYQQVQNKPLTSAK